MNKNDRPLEQDVSELIGILSSKVEDGQDVELAIYSVHDKRKPPHSIIYQNADTVKKIEERKVSKIIGVEYNVDEKAPGFCGPPYYVVKVFAPKPKPLPNGIRWIENSDEFILRFKDGKELIFTKIKDNSAKYFRLLIKRHGLYVKHDEAIQRIEDIKTNKQVRSVVQALNEKIQHNQLQSKIKIESDYKSAF